jgi:signal transduction histidine kinase
VRRSLILVTAGVTSMVVIAFLVPLGIMVSALAFDRAVTRAERDAESVARLVAVIGPSTSSDAVVGAIGEPRLIELGATLIFPDGGVAGLEIPQEEDLDAARSGTAFRSSVPDGEAVYVPVARADGELTVVRVVAPSDELTRGVWRSWLILGGLGVALVGLSILAADRFGRSIVRPVRELSDGAARLKAGDFSARVVPGGPPEIEEVGAEFNLLAEQVEHLLREERETAADLAHRLRTPLTAAKLDAEALPPGRATDRIVDDLDDLERTASFIIEEGRRPVRTEVDPGCNLTEVVEDRARYWSALSDEQGRSFAVSVSVGRKSGWVDVPRVDAAAMIDALLENVFAHTDEQAPLAVRLATTQNDGLILEVEDGGSGIDQPDALERGASTADSTGLGLDIVRRIAEASGGTLELADPGDLGGARVVVRLPRSTRG